MIRRAAGAVCLAVAATACGHPLFVPPGGPGVATDGSSAWASATERCRAAQSYSAALRVSGKAGAQRILGLAVQAAVTSDQIYLSATHTGRSIFLLVGSRARATLWLRTDERVVTAPASEIIEALLGLTVTPDRLLALFTGCVARDLNVTAASSYGRLLMVQTSDARVFLERDGAAWRTKAGEAEGFVAEFKWMGSSLPATVWLDSTPGREPRASIDVTVEDASLNAPLPANLFVMPAGAAAAQPMSIEELRAAVWKDEQ